MLVVIDIHALSDAEWRSSMIGIDTWDAYHEASRNDEPVLEVIDLVNAMKTSGHTVIGISARPEKWRKITNEWLLKNNVYLSELIMREDDDFRPSIEIKKEYVKRIHQISFVIDDREDFCCAVASMGIPALQVRR